MNYKIMELDKFKDEIYYRAGCSCGSNDHDITIKLETDKECKMIFMSLSQNMINPSYYKYDNFFSKIMNRIKDSLRLLIKGYVEMEGNFIFEGEKQIDNFIRAINRGRKYLKRHE